MEKRKYAEVILPVIKSQAKSVEQMSAKLGKTKATISTYITDCRNRGHDIVKTMRDGVAVYRYVSNVETDPAPTVIKFDTFKDPSHIDNRVKCKTKFIAKCLTDKLGFSISEQQAVLYGLHLADKDLNPKEFDD
jgi:biotin operon repressor